MRSTATAASSLLSNSLLRFVFFLLLGLARPAYSQDTGHDEPLLVGGRRMMYRADGLTTRKPGEPVIVFEGGVAAGTGNFGPLFARLSSRGLPWLAYARAGLYGSEVDESLRTDDDLVQRLHALLQARQVALPYLLVGHSLGGALMRLYTARYPAEVAGLVLLDPTNFMLTPAEDEQIRRQSGNVFGYYGLIQRMLDSVADDPTTPADTRRDFKRLADANRTTYFPGYATLPALPAIPVRVLLAYNGPIEGGEAALFERWHINGPAWFAQVNHYRMLHFADLIKQQPHSALVLLPGYVHPIHHMDPELVLATLQDVYKVAQKGGAK